MGNMDGIELNDPTLALMRETIENEEHEKRVPRDYLGASGLGAECERAIWYSINGAPQEKIGFKGLFAIEDGFRTEDLMAARLRRIPGIELYTHDEQGNQFGFSDLGGRFKGHIDGVIKGLIQAPKTPHIWENKSVNEKKFKKFQDCITTYGEKNALNNWDYTYFVQGILYMHYFDLTRHYLTVTTPGGRDVLSCRTEAQPMMAKHFREKAERIINLKETPIRIMDNPSYYVCKFCKFKDHCYKE